LLYNWRSFDEPTECSAFIKAEINSYGLMRFFLLTHGAEMFT